jgi:hypothetical protein
MEERLMSKKIMMTAMAAGLLLVGVFAGVGGAQIATTQERAHFLNTGLFTVAPGEGVNFRVSLDDRRAGAPMTVLLQLFDPDGAVVARDEVSLRPGQSTTLQVHVPGSYRAHAQGISLPSFQCERRTLVAVVEIFKTLNPAVPDRLMSIDDNRGPCFP